MDIEVLDSADAVAQRGAAIIAADAAAGVRAYGRYRVAFSGGRTPWTMLKALRGLDVPWPDVDVLQVDERIATDGDADRNLTHLQETLGGIAGVRVHAMPVTLPDPASAAATYAATLRDLAGSPPVLDLVHLGLGPDGHTASLIPGDAVLEVTDADVAATGVYQGRRRITLTYPALNRARRILWIVTGRDKTEMLRRLIDGDRSIPAGRVERERAMVVADREAMGGRLAEYRSARRERISKRRNGVNEVNGSRSQVRCAALRAAGGHVRPQRQVALDAGAICLCDLA